MTFEKPWQAITYALTEAASTQQRWGDGLAPQLDRVEDDQVRLFTCELIEHGGQELPGRAPNEYRSPPIYPAKLHWAARRPTIPPETHSIRRYRTGSR